MAKTPEELKACEVCGASIYPEHVKKALAGYLAGRLLCSHCLREKQQIAMVNPAAVFRDESTAQDDDEPIALAMDDEDEAGSGSPAGSGTGSFIGRVGGTSGGTTFAGPAIERQYQRELLKNAHATRCRTFHCKLNDPSFARLNEVINDWVDANEEIEIKFATSCIGMLEAKHSTDPHLIVTVFY
jgi:hypothetical protein